MDILQTVVVGIISGCFAGGTAWGMLRTQLAWLRRDVDDLREAVFQPAIPTRYKGESHAPL